MANDSFNELNQRMLAIQSAAQGNGAPKPVLGILPDANCGAGLSVQAMGGFDKPIMMRLSNPRKPNLIANVLGLSPDKLIEGFRQAAQGASANYTGPITHGGVPSSGGTGLEIG